MHILKYTFLVIVLLVTLPMFGYAQAGSISGKLVDAKSAPVAYATVTLFRTDSSIVSGDLSKDDGTFGIAPTGIGSFRLRIESIGMTTKYISVQVTTGSPDVNVGTIKLDESEHKLKEVNVVGEKPVMELKVDKKVFNVEKNTTATGGSATDVLQNVPSVSVDADGTVNLRGKSGVTILIDGKPATLLGSDVTSALQSMPASSIESVEVITNPSAKYDAQGTTGIINIITKKDGRLGMNGSATIGAGTGDKYNGNLSLNARKGKWNVFLNGGGRLNNTYHNVITDRQDTGANGNSYHTYEHVPRKHYGSFNTIGASFDPDKYNSFTLTENVNVMGFGFKDQSDYSVYGQPDYQGTILRGQNRNTDFAVNLASLSSALNYKRKFKKKDEELTADFTYAFTDFSRKQNYITINTPDTSAFNPIIERSPANGNNSTITIVSDYVNPMFTKNGKLGLGIKSQTYTLNSKSDPVISHAGRADSLNYAKLNDFNYTQQTNAAYINWNDQLGKFSYQLGVRFEDAIYDGTGRLPSSDSTAKDTAFHSDFFNFFPSAFVSYQLPNQQAVYLNYSRRVNRPGFMQLLPFIDLSNPGTVNTGNPSLIPEFINNFEFNYNKQDKRGDNIIVSVYYANTENLIEKLTTPMDSVTAQKYNVPAGTLLSKPLNIASGTTYGIEGTGNIKLTKAWDATVNLNFFNNELKVGNADPGLKNNNGSAWFAKMNTNYKLPKNFSLQLNANYESGKVITQGRLKETYWIDLALRKQLWKNKATLVINCSDIFNTHSSYTNYTLPAFTQVTNRVKETRVLNVSFTYRFGKQPGGNTPGRGMQGPPQGGRPQGGGKPEGGKKPTKPNEQDRDKNMKEGDDDNQGGGGGQGGGGQRSGGGGS